MAKITATCPTCGKILELTSSFELSPAENFNTYKCGHAFIETKKVHEVLTGEDFVTSSTNGSMIARDYQVEAVKFIKKTNFNCLLADQMGLGKTIEVLLALLSEYENRTPALILVKQSTLYQWIGEYKTWADPVPLGIFMIEGSKSWIPPGFKTYVCSMDTFSRIVGNPKESEKLLEFGFKCLIVDEIHSFKNSTSKRTQSLIQFIKKLSHRELEREILLSCTMCGNTWKETTKIEIDLTVNTSTAFSMHSTTCPKCGSRHQVRTDKLMQDMREDQERMGLVFLSGTPIKNRADEYFVPLNLLAPDRFPKLESFRRRYLEQNDSGKWSRVKPYMMEAFKTAIEPYVLRRERKDVLKDLPKFTRTFTTVFIDDENMKAAYNAEIDKLRAKNVDKEITAADIQDNIFTMRRIVGMAKVKFAANYIREYLEDVESAKLAVGVHHHSVRDKLLYELRDLRPVNIAAGKDIQYQVDTWKKPENQIGVISMLGGGVGLNLQFCSKILNIERQWNSADEEQLEDRFNRFGQEFPVEAEYLVARGTIDMWFSNMVEEKRQICGETFGVNFDPFESQSTMREMMQWAMENKL